jgi:surface protein
MFIHLSAIRELDLSNFNTSKITTAQGMFSNLDSIEELDLSSFDMSSATDLLYMFSSMPNLITIYVSEKWDVSHYGETPYNGEMFYYVPNLSGYYGTVYNADYARWDRAHIDGGEENPGYLTHVSHKGETHTVTYPDGTVEIKKHNAIITLGDNNTKADRVDDLATITFKLHNGEDDIIKHVQNVYYGDGFLVNGVLYNDNSNIRINEDKIIEYNYKGYPESPEFPKNPQREGYSFFGWYTEEDGQGEKYTEYNYNEDIVLHAYWNDPYAEFAPGYEFTSKMNDLIYGPEYDYDHPAKYFRKATLEEYNLAKDMIESDVDENGNNKHIVSSENTGDLIYAWKSGDDLLYYSKTDNIHLNEYSNSMFSHLPFE